LFEKRFAVFGAVSASLEYYRRGESPDEQLFEYRRSVAEANFLFESDIDDFIREIDKHALRLWLVRRRTRPRLWVMRRFGSQMSGGKR